jgi:predicted AlkP superfamily pyrophosphatase or phosphodiesterase
LNLKVEASGSKVQTIYEWLREEEKIQDQLGRWYENPGDCLNGGDCRSAVFSNHYARGADWWGTSKSLVAWLAEKAGSLGEWFRDLLPDATVSKKLDETTTEEVIDFFDRYYPPTDPSLGGVSQERRFPAVFTVYYAGLDHYAHSVGMDGEAGGYTGYTDFFQKKTDIEIKSLIDKLKELGEFDNKIFIIVSDHGHTAMPTGMKYRHVFEVLPDSGIITEEDREAEMSCKLKLDFQIDPENPDTGMNNRKAELANNNLHIWELAESLKSLNEKKADLNYRVLAPLEISNLFLDSPAGARRKLHAGIGDFDFSNVVAAFNGPMAHIYLRGDQGWKKPPAWGKL